MVNENLHLSSHVDNWLQACTSEKIRKLLEKANRYAAASDPVLILGECGTGKTQLAYHVHRAGRKHGHPVIHVACGKFACDLSTSYSGVENGWYTLLERHGRNPDATWLFEGVDEIPLALQSVFSGIVDDILQFDGRSHPFVLSTATRDLDDALEEGRFRKDLFYKLNVLQLSIPSLRERKEDISPLVSHFLSGIRPTLKTSPSRFSDDAIAVLSDHHWPGNIVELRNVISQVCVLSDCAMIDSEQLLSHWQFPRCAKRKDFSGLNLEEAETRLILEAVARYQGNKTAAAKQLGISTRTLQNKMQKYRRLGFVS